MAGVIYPNDMRIFGVKGQSGADYIASRVIIDSSGPSTSLRPQSVCPSRGYNDMMPDDYDWSPSPKITDDGPYSPPPRRKKRGLLDQWIDEATEKEKERNREFRSEGNNGLTVVYQISKFRWSRSSADKVRDRVYALIADRTRVERQKVIDEQESMFNYEIIVEIQFKKASLIKQFEELVRKTGASVEEVK